MDPIAIGQFYDRAQRWYNWAYFDKDSLGIHYGFWDANTRTRTKALLNQYRQVRDMLQIQSGERILDAGCGVGGASLWLAAHTPAEYIGITVSAVQVRMARQYARQRRLDDRVGFQLQDYTHTDFPAGSFDAVFGIESFCYAYPRPEQLFKEMHRLIKSGGRLVMSDGILLRRPHDPFERQLADNFARGYAMSGWNTSAEIIQALRDNGFTNIQMVNKTTAIAESVRDIDRRQRLPSAIIRGLSRLRIVSEPERLATLATSVQRPFYESGLFGYAVFSAVRR